jgi:hypothetical protein
VEPAIRCGGLGAIEGRICHLWHGESADRSYGSRQKILKQASFEPSVDLQISSSGAWSWSSFKPKLHDFAEGYFALRREDGTSIQTAGTIRQWRDQTRSTAGNDVCANSPSAMRDLRSPLLENCSVYEWHAWDGYMLPRIIPKAHRLEAKPLEPLDRILKRIPRSTTVFAFHLNFTKVHRFPLCRDELCSELSARGIRLLNASVVDISKKTVQSTCQALGLRSVLATRFVGSMDDLVIVKTNCNYGGYGEKQLSGDERRALGLPLLCPLENRWDYRIVHRESLPDDWWEDPSLVVENYVCNSAGLKYRSYFVGNSHVLVATVADSLVMRLSTNRVQKIICTSRQSLQSGSVEDYPVSLQVALVKLIDHMRLDFGAIDFVQDGAGEIYAVDVNTTTFAKGLSRNAIEHLREGLSEHLQ